VKLVLDTNVWLDWLVFDDAGVVELKRAVAEGRATVLIDAECLAELERVLGYPLGRWTLDESGRRERMAQCLSRCVFIEKTTTVAAVPRCADPDDQKFLALAAAAGADALVTKDAALLRLGKRTPFRIVRPGAIGV